MRTQHLRPSRRPRDAPSVGVPSTTGSHDGGYRRDLPLSGCCRVTRVFQRAASVSTSIFVAVTVPSASVGSLANQAFT